MKDWLNKLSKDQGVTPELTWIQKGFTHDEVQKLDLPDPEWFIPTLIPNPGLIAITGRPGHFKTFFTQWIALRLSAKLPLFDGIDSSFLSAPKSSIGVVFVEEEMNARQIKLRANQMKSWGHDNFHWFISSGFSLKDKEKVSELRKYIETNNIKLLVLDPFTTCAEMKDENSNAEAREVMDVIRHEFVDTEHGCTVIFIHHPSKGEGSSENIRGAGDILGKCDMHFVLEKIGEGRTTVISIKCKKTRFIQPDDFIAEMVEDEKDFGRLEWKYRGTHEDKFKQECNLLKEKILHNLTDESYTQKDLALVCSTTSADSKFVSAWNDLIDNDLIQKIDRYKWKKS
ncbi:MAG: AAA family ATPase [Candidatus Roizmanbacteria bacterium]|nr:AAA family ATPase [Candidatus Roizmanbacteria bacterium]